MAASTARAENASQGRAEVLVLGADLGQALDAAKELGPVPHQFEQPQLIVAEHGGGRSILRQTFERLHHQRVGRAAAALIEREAVDQFDHVRRLSDAL